MEVKGTAFLARKLFIIKEHGEEKFDQVMADVVARDPLFGSAIVATTRIDVSAFLRFNDAFVSALYGGDVESYFRFGAASAEWALTDGPYKHLVATRSVERFAASAPVILRTYFTDGEARGVIGGDDRVDVYLHGLEPHHVYFEYAVMGYFGQGLQMVAQREVSMKVHRGFSRGDSDVHYEFRLGGALPARVRGVSLKA